MGGQVRTLSGVSVLAGLWLIIAPFVLNYNVPGNTWQEVVFGAAVVILGLVRMAMPSQHWANWTIAAIGIWMIIAPWAIAGTSAASKWNEVIAGIVIALLGYASAVATDASESRQHVIQ